MCEACLWLGRWGVCGCGAGELTGEPEVRARGRGRVKVGTRSTGNEET